MIDPENIDEYIAMDGYKALTKVLTEMTEQVIEEVKNPAFVEEAVRFPNRYQMGICI